MGEVGRRAKEVSSSQEAVYCGRESVWEGEWRNGQQSARAAMVKCARGNAGFRRASRVFAHSTA